VRKEIENEKLQLGNKDRMASLSAKTLALLREYYKG
jgi:hypothetical protein